MIQWRPPLNAFLLTAFLVVALVPVLVITIWIQKHAYNQELASVRDKHLLLAHNLTGALSRYAKDIRAVFVDVIKEEHQSVDEEHRQLMKTMGIELLATVDAYGRLLTLDYGELDRLPAGDLVALLNSDTLFDDREVRWSGVRPDRHNRPSIYLLKQNKAGNYALGALNLSYIHVVQEAVTFGEKGHAAIVDHRGHILAHPKKEWQQEMKNISALKPVQKMMAGHAGVIQFFSPAMKADMIAGYAAVPATGWGVMIPQPLSELKDRAQNVRGVAMSVVAGSLLIAFILAWWLSATVTGPIHRTVQAALRLANKSPGGRTEIPAGLMASELKTLCLQFNRMAAQVEQARTSLEERVEERTTDLLKEIEQRKQLEEKLRYLASHDELTGLPKRSLFLQLLTQALLIARRKTHGVAVCFIDVDGFKEVNDRLGHHVGDQLLKEIARRLTTILRSVDVASRYGGDEFNLLLVDSGSREELSRIADKILQAIVEPVLIEGEEIVVTASMGIVVSQGEDGADELLKKADEAMYAAKGEGKNRYRIA
jgi:diguanylate cyclase (GGDEF)-like protein